jgi:hypothetical protein
LTLYELQRDIRRASRSVAFQWPGVVDADDVEQSINLRLMESPGSVTAILAMDEKARYRAIVGVGHQIASAERTDYDHYKGAYRYSADEVKKLLNRGVLTEPLEGFNEAVTDLMEGLESMVLKQPQYVEAVVSRYADERPPQSKSEEHALSRGLTALTDAMNKSSRVRFSERDDGTGTRSAMTNEHARWVSRNEYSGSDPDWDGPQLLEGVEGGTGWSAR